MCLDHYATVVMSESTANLHTVQQPKPYKQREIPTIQALVISKVLLPQPNIMAAFVHSHSKLLSGASLSLPTYNVTMSHNLQLYAVRLFPVELIALV